MGVVWNHSKSTIFPDVHDRKAFGVVALHVHHDVVAIVDDTSKDSRAFFNAVIVIAIAIAFVVVTVTTTTAAVVVVTANRISSSVVIHHSILHPRSRKRL